MTTVDVVGKVVDPYYAWQVGDTLVSEEGALFMVVADAIEETHSLVPLNNTVEGTQGILDYTSILLSDLQDSCSKLKLTKVDKLKIYIIE